MKVKVGDVVHVRATVTHASDAEIGLSVGNFNAIWLPSEVIVHVEPRTIKVGDRVRPKAGGTPGEVMSMDCNFCWVRWSGGYATRSVFELELADE